MGDLLSAQNQPLAAQAWGLCMRGSIRSRQRCPECGQVGRYRLREQGRGRLALVCECGKFATTTPEIRLRWGGHQYTIRHDTQGNEFPSYEHARRALEVIRSSVDQGTFDPAYWASADSNRLLWANYLADYLASEEARLLPERAATMGKKRALARHLAWFNKFNVREIRTAHLQDFAALPCLRLALAPKSQADLLGELRHIFRRALARDDIEKLPQMPTVEVPEKEIRWLRPETHAQVLAEIPARHRPIFACMFTYALRPAEACALCWDKLDRDNGCFYVSRTFSRRQLRDTSKTRHSDVLPLGKEFAAYLDSLPPGIGRTPVFRNPEANRTRNHESFYTPDALNKLWARAVEAVGLDPIPLYNGNRHSRAMQALNLEDWGIEAVRRLLRHSSEKHTRRYARAEVDLLRGLIDHKRKVVRLKGRGGNERGQ